MRSGLLGSVAGDVPLQGRLDDVRHLVAALVHERERFVPDGSDADGADGRLSGRGSPYHAKNVTQKSGLTTCGPSPPVPFLYYRKRERAGEMAMRHITIKASELGEGDLMRIGSSTNYVLVYSAKEVDSRIAVTIYSGDEPNPNGATLHLKPSDTASLSPHGTSNR